MFAVDAETQLPDDLLLLTDKMSMAVSLECRVPLLDHQLVELAAPCPASIKVRDGRLKHLMKAPLPTCCPTTSCNRQKRGFGTPMGAWLKRELAPLLRPAAGAGGGRTRAACFIHALVARLIADHDANRIDGTDILLALLNLEIWSRIYLDGVTRPMSPTKNSRATWHEHPLHLPPLPLSAQARRQDSALQHDPPPHAAARVTVCSLARSAAGGRGRAGDCRPLRNALTWGSVRTRADAAHGRPPAADDALVDGLFLFARAAAPG
jgi:hypothetical protein